MLFLRTRQRMKIRFRFWNETMRGAGWVSSSTIQQPYLGHERPCQKLAMPPLQSKAFVSHKEKLLKPGFVVRMHRSAWNVIYPRASYENSSQDLTVRCCPFELWKLLVAFLEIVALTLWHFWLNSSRKLTFHIMAPYNNNF